MTETPKVRTCLLFNGKAQEAVDFYTSLLDDSRVERVVDGIEPGAGAMVLEFTIAGTPYLALDAPVDIPFTNAMSISVLSASQAETDRLWETLGEGGAEGHCGWITDRYGVAWQIVPEEMPALIGASDRAAASRAFQALMGMQKIDIAALKSAFANEEAA